MLVALPPTPPLKHTAGQKPWSEVSDFPGPTLQEAMGRKLKPGPIER